jgi:hypothetical protein
MTREDIKVEISPNHYGEPKPVSSSEPTKLVIQSLSSDQVGYDVQKSWF